ncbi:MAG: hypothetical protein M3376_06705, partial [Actinomycetota bacterium]|nr:hypothetical protein [Actinomycetota bacterium]
MSSSATFVHTRLPRRLYGGGLAGMLLVTASMLVLAAPATAQERKLRATYNLAEIVSPRVEALV